MQFLDEAKIFLKSGEGGRGSKSFRREKFEPLGGPDGGDGGKGGDIVFRAAHGLNTLIDFRYQQHFKAEHGKSGKGSNCYGASAPTLYINVPVGTQILAEDKESLIAELLTEGQQYRIAKGGDGGLGNMHFVSSTNRSPERATPGWPGQEMWVWLQLKLIADVGLIGMPNAGKSTLLSRVTAARPKIADYPFTTLKPQLGVVRVGLESFVMADIPGLIEGAHEGIGLGHRFLRHIERCHMLLHLIDVTQEDVLAAYHTIRTELGAYSATLAAKPELVVLTKIDAVTAEELQEKQQLLSEQGCEVRAISAVAGTELEPLLWRVWQHLKGDED